MPYRLLGQILGTDDSTVSLAASRVIPIMEQLGITTPAGQPRTSTLAQLNDPATAQGIDITPIREYKPQKPSHQDDTDMATT